MLVSSGIVYFPLLIFTITHQPIGGVGATIADTLLTFEQLSAAAARRNIIASVDICAANIHHTRSRKVPLILESAIRAKTSRLLPTKKSLSRNPSLLAEKVSRKTPCPPNERVKQASFGSLMNSHVITLRSHRHVSIVEARGFEFVNQLTVGGVSLYSRLQLRLFRVPVFQYTLGWSKTPDDHPEVYRGPDPREQS